jgi:hypothetical protein
MSGARRDTIRKSDKVYKRLYKKMFLMCMLFVQFGAISLSLAVLRVVVVILYFNIS